MKSVIPADLATATDEDLKQAEVALLAEADEMIDAKSTDVAALTEVAEAVEAVRAEIANRAEAAEKAAAEVAAIAERLRPAATADPEEGSDEAADETEEAEASDETPTEISAEETEEAEERELVTASADKSTPKPPSARAVSRRSPAVETPKAEPQVVITAAAEIPGYAGGSDLDRVALAKALHAKARTLADKSGYVPIASINLPMEHKITGDTGQAIEVLERATSPESLTAAGWCAPSQNLYTLFGIDAADGLIDLPTVQISRGGLNVPSFLGFPDAEENGGLWTWTEAYSDDPYASKPCVYIPCPDFTDYRLTAEGICVTNGNLTDRAFPELTTRYVDLVMNTHFHRLSSRIIDKIYAMSEFLIMDLPLDPGFAGNLLWAIDVQVADYRSRFRMSTNSVLEILLPLWAKEAIRADLALRTAVNLVAVSDEMIMEYFRVRHVRPQFLHDYLPMNDNAPKYPYTSAATAFPTEMGFTIFPAGGIVRGDGGVIDLGIVRDSVLNATNDYTAAWTEQMYLVAQLGPKPRTVTVAVDVNGTGYCCQAEVVG